MLHSLVRLRTRYGLAGWNKGLDLRNVGTAELWVCKLLHKSVLRAFTSCKLSQAGLGALLVCKTISGCPSCPSLGEGPGFSYWMETAHQCPSDGRSCCWFSACVQWKPLHRKHVKTRLLPYQLPPNSLIPYKGKVVKSSKFHFVNYWKATSLTKYSFAAFIWINQLLLAISYKPHVFIACFLHIGSLRLIISYAMLTRPKRPKQLSMPLLEFLFWFSWCIFTASVRPCSARVSG